MERLEWGPSACTLFSDKSNFLASTPSRAPIPQSPSDTSHGVKTSGLGGRVSEGSANVRICRAQSSITLREGSVLWLTESLRYRSS